MEKFPSQHVNNSLLIWFNISAFELFILLVSLSLLLTIWIWLSQYFHIHFNRTAAEWFMDGWLGHALHVKGHPCWWKKQTWTQSGVFELLSPAALGEERWSQWTQEDTENHTRVKTRGLIEFNGRQTCKDCRLHAFGSQYSLKPPVRDRIRRWAWTEFKVKV